jgi:protein-arginine kinase activator protein McsA
MNEVSVTLEEEEIIEEIENNLKKTDLSLDKMNRDELIKALDEAVAMENYEKASYIRDLINKLK